MEKVQDLGNAVVNEIFNGKPVRQVLSEAYDLFGDDESFFTKEELVEFADNVIDLANDVLKSEGSSNFLMYSGVWLEDDDRTVTVDFKVSPDDLEGSASVKVDMRQIKSPNDLSKYIDKLAKDVISVVKDILIFESALNEELVTSYKGYAIYHVSDGNSDWYEIWKSGHRVGPRQFETEDAAKDWLDSQMETKAAVDYILDGHSLEEALFNINQTQKDTSLKALDVYSNSKKFQDLIKSFIDQYEQGKEFSVQLEFAVDRSDMDSSGASITLGSIGDKIYLEVARLLDGKLTTEKRVSAQRYVDACNLFKSLVDKAETLESDENKIVVTVISDGYEQHLEMDNPSYLPKAANESALTEQIRKFKVGDTFIYQVSP